MQGTITKLRTYVDHWGTTEAERELDFPCDALLQNPDQIMYRAVSVEASANLVYRWLCQMRVAPYSYDLVDNLGRTSPRKLTPGLEQLEIGQKFMFIFRLVSFDEQHLTLRTRGPFGELIGTYLVTEQPTRIVVKLIAHYRKNPIGWLTRFILPWGDWFMMRKQLLTFKELAEQSA